MTRLSVMPRAVFLDEPPDEVVAWLKRRSALGRDRHDEVWEGDYHVAPMAHARHGDVQAQLAEILGPLARRKGLRPVGEVNIGTSEEDFRVPDFAVIRGRDLAVFLPTAAIVVEVVSPGDESYAKFGFYLARGVEELLVVDPERCAVEWYGRGPDGFVRSGASALLGLNEATLHGRIDWPPAG
jgi:Uma2 family endonuclease